MDEQKKMVELWQGQPLAESELNMEMVMAASEKFQRKIRFRNVTEYVASGAVVAWAAVFVSRSEAPLLVKLGMALVGLGAVGVATVLRLRGHAAEATPPLAAPTSEVVSWHRSELVRQRDLLRHAPLWYLGPFVPGLVLVLVGAWLASPGHGLQVGLIAGLIGLVFAGVAGLNLRGANKLDEQIEALGRELDG